MSNQPHLSRRAFLRLTGSAGLSVALTAVGPRAGQALATGSRPTAGPESRVDGVNGFVTHDLAPGSTPLGGWDHAAATTLDADYLSVGADLGAERAFNTIELFSANASTRLERADLSVYTSADNVAYEKIADWDFIQTGDRITIFNFSARARYVKVHNHFRDDLADYIDEPLYGWVNNDVSPEAGNLTALGHVGGFAFDYAKRSAGMDLRRPKTVTRITLHNQNEETRLVASDLAVYVSQHNAGDWRLVEGVDIEEGPSSFVLSGFEEVARYLKVTQPYTDTAFTFANQLPAMIEVDTVESDPDPEGYPFRNALQDLVEIHDRPDNAWTRSGGGTWAWYTPVTIRNPEQETVNDRCFSVDFDDLDVDGLIRRQMLHEDLRDARWVDADLRELQYHEDGAAFLVRVPELAPGEQRQVFFFYGNRDALPRGSGREALQVEHGNRTVVRWPEGYRSLKPAVMPDGTLMVSSSTDVHDGMHAHYSSDRGRTWSDAELLVPPVDPGEARDVPGGFHVDPDTGVTTFVFFASYRYSAIPRDSLNPEVCRCELHVVQTDRYEQGRPQFSAEDVRSVGELHMRSGHVINYALTYCHPVRAA